MFCKKGALRNFAKFTGKHLCQSLFLNKFAGRNFIKEETLAQMFSSEFCKTSNNAFSYRTPLVAISVSVIFFKSFLSILGNFSENVFFQ